MSETVLAQSRRWTTIAMSGVLGFGVAWMAFPGLPVLWGPRASGEVRKAGRELFEREWTPHDPVAQEGGDGLGPVFNARSCVDCHFQGGVGGGGGSDQNVLAFEAKPTRGRPQVESGLIHKFAVANHFTEGLDALRKHFPIIPNAISVSNGCYVVTRDFDPLKTQRINSTALFGAGWIDRIPGKTIYQRAMGRSIARIGREIQGNFEGIVPGRPRVLPDGRIGKFGWKAQFATLEEFVAAASANELGLGNPKMEQAKPMNVLEYPEVDPDLNEDQFTSLVAFVDTLPKPVQILPEGPAARSRAERGQYLFNEIGCAACHLPDLAGVEGVYSDFLLHRIEDRPGNDYSERELLVPLPEEHPRADEWKTPPLWGVADSSPYFHDGGSPTLTAAVLRHQGGAISVTNRFKKLPDDDKASLIAFLKTLKAPPDAPTLPRSVVPFEPSLARAN